MFVFPGLGFGAVMSKGERVGGREGGRETEKERLERRRMKKLTLETQINKTTITASKVTDGMLLASARAVAAAVPDAKVAAGELYPPVSDLRAVSLRVAAAVAAAARDEGVARAEGLPRATGDSAFDDAAMREYIMARMWWPTGAEPEGWPGI